MEKAIRDDFIPSLFGEDQATPVNFWRLLALSVKHACIALPNPAILGPANHKASILVCSHVLAVFHGTTGFSTVDHLSVGREVFQELQKRKDVEYLESLASSLLWMPVETRRPSRGAKKQGCGLPLHPPPSMAPNFPSKNSRITYSCAMVSDPPGSSLSLRWLLGKV